LTKCRFCNAEAIGIFELESSDGHTWEAPLCLEDALLLQGQGYSTHVKKKEKKVMENEND
jgi:hypothetical protein